MLVVGHERPDEHATGEGASGVLVYYIRTPFRQLPVLPVLNRNPKSGADEVEKLRAL